MESIFSEIQTSFNRAPMHSPFGAYETEKQAAEMDRSASRYTVSLNGSWDFCVYETIQEIPKCWAEKPTEGLRKITVPSCLEFEGIGKPVYTNIMYPFDRKAGDHSFETEITEDEYELNAPLVPRENKTVCYYRKFVMPECFQKRKTFLNFGGVETAFELAVNGKTVGYSEDSKLDAEFEITDYIKEGENLIAVRVSWFSPHSYLEDQDYWHVHGIYRDVTLYSKDLQRMLDFKVQPVFGESLAEAALEVSVWPDHSAPLFGACRVKMSLFDAQGAEVSSGMSKPFAEYGVYLDEKYVVRETIPVDSPELWNCERPYLYTLVLKLQDADGHVTDIESCRVGFREIRIAEGILQINRRRMIIRGVNLHEWSAYTGRTVSREELKRTLLTAKALNFNAIRTCHYPKSVYFYELCDELGLYVVDEANIETHGYGGGLSNSYQWLHAYMDRAIRMCLRDKNHPCIIAWSLGNESGLGVNQGAMYGWMKAYDSRPVQYESGGSPANISDIIAPMYATRDWVEECMSRDDKRPFIMCEYAYSKSNSNGNFAEFWELIRKYPRFQGGFLWDFADKAIAQKGQDEKLRFRYAGAFGESVMDPVKDMCLNGIVYADLEKKPAAEEVKNCQAPVYIKYEGSGNCRLYNEYMTSDLTDLEFDWELVRDGICVERGVLENVRIDPGKEIGLEMPYDKRNVSGETFWNLYVRLKNDQVYAKAGHVIYKAQLEAEGSFVYTEKENIRSDCPLKVRRQNGFIYVEGERLRLVYDEKRGGLLSCSVDSRELFSNVKNRFYRAATGIDEGQISNCYSEEWKLADLENPEVCVEAVRVFPAANFILLEEELSFCGGKIKTDREYLITEAGMRMTARIHNHMDLDTIARIGQSFELPKEFENLKWYGRGPQEAYTDRKSSAFVGIYENCTNLMHEHYVKPCECGGREDVRWLEIRNEEGRGMKIWGSSLFHFSALPWTIEQYDRAAYQEELGESKGISLVLDGWHAGLGGDTGWSKNIHPEYRIPKGLYLYELFLKWI